MITPTSDRSELEDSVFSMYRSLAIGRNDVCQRCRLSQGEVEVWGPISIYHVGNRFGDDGQRILFAGKTARAAIGEDEEDEVDDTTSWSEGAIRGKGTGAGARRWPYWTYTRAIIEELYGSLDDGWEKVALTNLLKCNLGSRTDTSSPTMKNCCLRDLGVFRREMQIIQPRNIVLYAGRAYDDYLGDLFPEGWRSVRETNRDTTRPCGRKDLPWLEAEVLRDGVLASRVLRTGHPERMNKAEFVRMVVEWLRQSC